jgi:hypothetical protein
VDISGVLNQDIHVSSALGAGTGWAGGLWEDPPRPKAVHMIRALSPANECTCANDGLWGMKFGLPTMGAAPIHCALTWGKLQPLA